MNLSQLLPRNWNSTFLKLAIVALLAVYSYPSFTALSSGDFEYVQRVVDGDTLVLGTDERVRLIGVDTPESVRPNTPVQHFGKEAADFTRRMVEGKRVRLEYDQANAARGHKDNTQQKRTLAYVFLEDGTLLNVEIVKQGYGHALTRYLSHGWKSLGSWSVRRASNAEDCGLLANRRKDD